MINSSIDNLRIELNEYKIRKSISVRQGDIQTRTIHVTIAQSGKAYVLDNCLYAEMLIKKADDKECVQNMVIVGNELQYTWRTQDINAVGSNECQIRLTFKDHSILTTPIFELLVYQPEVNADVVASMNEYTSATEQLILANEYREKAQESAENASASEDNAEHFYRLAESYAVGTDDEIRAGDSVDNAKTYAEKAKEDAAKVESGVAEAREYALDAEVSAGNALASENIAKEARQYALIYQNAAELHKNEAEFSKMDAKDSEDNAKESSEKAKESEINAKNSEEKAKESEMGSKSYAVGTDDEIREGDSTDNAKYYYEQTKRISQGLGAGIIPMGTIRFEELPMDAEQGWMYNISDDFTTTDRFVEGAGKRYTAGTNVNMTSQGLWDCMAGSTATMDSAMNTVTFEDRETRSNIESGEEHSSIFAKIKKVFSDLKEVAFTNDFNDLLNRPSSLSEFTNDVGFITGYTETDPTVPDWAKAANKPSYTAQEVGALPSSTVIPTVPTNVSAFNNDAGYITGYTETDPTVPDWAKAANKPSYTPSEVGFTDVEGTLAANATSLTISNSKITTSSTLEVFTDVFGVTPTAMTVSEGKVVFTFKERSSQTKVKLRIS